jgi:hypothetical protein
MQISIFLYLKYLIAGNTAEIARIKELNILFKSFKSSKFRYATKDKKITNLFLQKVNNLYQQCLTLRTVLESTIFAPDEKKALLFLNYFIDCNLPPEIASKKEKFTKEAIWQKMIESDNPNKTIKSIQDEFTMYKNNFVKSKMPKFESEYYALYRLYSLASFYFESLFSKFDADFISGSASSACYSPATTDELVNDISDIYYLISLLPPKTDLSNAFTKLYARISEENSKALAKTATQAVNSIYKIVSDELPPDKLITLAKFISENPKLRLPVENKPFSILEKYRKEIEEKFAKTKDIIMERYSEQSQIQEIKSLFKDKTLLPINGYTEELVEAIEENNFEPIVGIQALKVTKTFVMEIYEQSIRDSINSLIVEAFFNEKDYQSEFSNRYFAANELKDFFIEFEENLSNSAGNSFRLLNAMFMKNVNSNEMRIRKVIETVNDKIIHCNKKCAEVFYNLAVKIYEILQDYKLPKPIRINNIKQIKGSINREYVNNLANYYGQIAKYIKIIKSFIPMNPQEKK